MKKIRILPYICGTDGSGTKPTIDLNEPELQDELPTMASWLSEAMHRRPLLRQQTGSGATVTEFNKSLKQDLELIGADTNFTFHCIRDMRIAEAGESGNSQVRLHTLTPCTLRLSFNSCVRLMCAV